MRSLFIPLLFSFSILAACGDKDGGDSGAPGDGGADGGTADGGADGGTSDGGATDGGTGDGGTGDGGTGDGGTGDGGTGDGGADGGTGDGGTSDGGTGDGGTEVPCLRFQANATTPTGVCVTCPTEEDLTMQATVENTCDEDVTLSTNSACLVRRWSVTGGDPPLDRSPKCKKAPTDRVIKPGARLSDRWLVGPLDAGSYVLDARFDDVDAHRGTANFEVVAPE